MQNLELICSFACLVIQLGQSQLSCFAKGLGELPHGSLIAVRHGDSLNEESSKHLRQNFVSINVGKPSLPQGHTFEGV